MIETNKIFPKVFGWMFIGLLMTFITGYVLSLSPFAMEKILGSFGVIIVIIVELALVIFLSARITKMKPITAKISFLLYAFVSGFTFSTIFMTYDMSSVMYVFLITAVIFAIFALLGATTKIDLTKLGTFLTMALLAIFICIIVNIFMQNSTFDLIISIVLIVIFIGFTAYDVQKIKELAYSNLLPEENMAIYGALNLYLDFINIFLQLLSIFGQSDD